VPVFYNRPIVSKCSYFAVKWDEKKRIKFAFVSVMHYIYSIIEIK